MKLYITIALVVLIIFLVIASVYLDLRYKYIKQRVGEEKFYNRLVEKDFRIRDCSKTRPGIRMIGENGKLYISWLDEDTLDIVKKEIPQEQFLQTLDALRIDKVRLYNEFNN